MGWSIRNGGHQRVDASRRQYALSFYVGSERSFFYTVKFEVK
jgi:hypothetical protein